MSLYVYGTQCASEMGHTYVPKIIIHTSNSTRGQTSDLHSTMSCVLSEELALTPLEAVQVMVAKALSLITLVTLRVLVTLSSAMESFVRLVIERVVPSSLKGISFKDQEMFGAETSVAVHITTTELPSDTVALGFGEMVAMRATATRSIRK